jgi:hypothetical protein
VPHAVTIGSTSICTAKVFDADSGQRIAPRGSVTFTTNGHGKFSPKSSCILVDDSCHVDYAPSLVGTGFHTVTATFLGDANHVSSANSQVVAVKSALTSAATISPSVVKESSSGVITLVTHNANTVAATATITVTWDRAVVGHDVVVVSARSESTATIHLSASARKYLASHASLTATVSVNLSGDGATKASSRSIKIDGH